MTSLASTSSQSASLGSDSQRHPKSQALRAVSMRRYAALRSVLTYAASSANTVIRYSTSSWCPWDTTSMVSSIPVLVFQIHILTLASCNSLPRRRLGTSGRYSELQQVIPYTKTPQLGLHAVTHYGHTNIKAWHTNMPVYVFSAPAYLVSSKTSSRLAAERGHLH